MARYSKTFAWARRQKARDYYRRKQAQKKALRATQQSQRSDHDT